MNKTREESDAYRDERRMFEEMNRKMFKPVTELSQVLVGKVKKDEEDEKRNKRGNEESARNHRAENEL